VGRRRVNRDGKEDEYCPYTLYGQYKVFIHFLYKNRMVKSFIMMVGANLTMVHGKHVWKCYNDIPPAIQVIDVNKNV
jgi:hypothetical protein